ncbi:MAG: cupredoxin domain-containing protein [bacterium]
MGLAQLLVPKGGGGRPADATDRYSEGWAWVRVRGEFSPDLIEARAGERLRLVFRREETAACSERVVVPSLGKSVMLPPFEDVAVDLGPLPPGEHEFSCGLGVLRGRIVVCGQGAEESVASTEAKAAPGPDGGAGVCSYAASENGNRMEVIQMKRPTVNITPAERLGRIFVGLVGVIGGLILLGSAGGAVVAVLEVLLVLAGLDLIVTGALGHCPLYRKLGHVPPSLRSPA